MKKVRNFFRYDNAGLLFILPAFIYMMVFVGYPILSNLILSLQDVSVRNLVNGDKHFIAFQNYVDIFHDDVFLMAMNIRPPVDSGKIVLDFPSFTMERISI